MRWFGDIAKLVSMRDLRAGNSIPEGYGFAYIKTDTLYYVFYPIPFHLAVRAWRWLVDIYWAITVHPTERENTVLMAYAEGRKECLAQHARYYENELKRQHENLFNMLKESMKERQLH